MLSRAPDRSARALDRGAGAGRLVPGLVLGGRARVVERAVHHHALLVDRRRRLRHGRHRLRRFADRAHAPGRHRGGVPHPPLLDRLHARRSGLRALLHLPEPVRVLDGDAGAGRQLPPALRLLGGGRPLLLSADRLLVHAEGGRQTRARRRSSSTASATSASASASCCSGSRSARSTTARSSTRPTRALAPARLPRIALLLFMGACGKSAQLPLTPGCPTRWRARRRCPR